MKIRALIGMVVALFMLSACVDGVPGVVSKAGKTPAEIKLEQDAQALNKQSRSIVVRNTVQGALVGAAVGCGIGLLLGGDEGACLRGAAVGGIAGGVGGNAVGQQAAAANRELVKRDEVLANLRRVSGGLTDVERQLRAVIRSQNSEIRSLRRQASAGQISDSAVRSRIRSINSNRSAVSATLGRTEANMANTTNEINQARQQGQRNLGALRNASSSTKNRIARARSSIRTVAAD